MKKKILISSVSILVILLVFISIFFFKNRTRMKNTDSITIDVLMKNPKKFTDIINVEGFVMKIDKQNNLIVLGCKDACLGLPIKLKSKTYPDMNSEIIVKGKILLQDNKYIFDMIDFRYKNDI